MADLSLPRPQGYSPNPSAPPTSQGYSWAGRPPCSASTPSPKMALLRTSASASRAALSSTGSRRDTNWADAAPRPCMDSASVPTAKDFSATVQLCFWQGKECKSAGNETWVVHNGVRSQRMEHSPSYRAIMARSRQRRGQRRLPQPRLPAQGWPHQRALATWRRIQPVGPGQGLDH